MTAPSANTANSTMSPIMCCVLSFLSQRKEAQKGITMMYTGHIHKPLNNTCGCECACDESGDGGGYSCGSDCYMCD